MDTENLVKEIMDLHKKSFELKAKLTEDIDGHSLADILPALIMVYTEILMNCFASEDEAANQIGEFSARCMMALKAFSQEGLCAWNKPETLQ